MLQVWFIMFKFQPPSLIETESHYQPPRAYERYERFVIPPDS